MDSQISQIRIRRQVRREDLPQIERLLALHALPVEGVADHLENSFAVATHADRIIGVAGIEVYGRAGLLRSVAVDPEFKGQGLGVTLVQDRLAWAREHGLEELYLLTTTAKDFFPRFGFAVADRAEAPAAMQRAPEFAYLCASTATTMRLSL